jgi:phage-related protein
MIEAGGSMLSRLVNYIMQNLPRFLSMGIQLIGRLAMGLIRALPNIIGSLARVLAQLIQTIIRNLPQFLAQGIQMIGKIATGIIRAIPQVVRTVPSIFSRIAGAFRGINWGSLGSQVINGIKNGISRGATAVVNAAKNLAKNAFNAAKNFLGIESPSKKFKWIAEMSTEGIVRGTDKGIPKVVDMATEMAKAAVGAFNDNYALQSQGVSFTAPEPVLASAGGSYTISVPLSIDGRTFARATATYTQTELDRLGTQKNRRAGL